VTFLAAAPDKAWKAQANRFAFFARDLKREKSGLNTPALGSIEPGTVYKEKVMTYYFSKKVSFGFDEAVSKITQALKKEGFGILTEIDVKSTLKKKLDIDFRNYRILGACNPPFAYKALQAEDKVGTMLPCNVIVQEMSNGDVEIAAIDPIASMKAIDNPELREIAETIAQKLKFIVENV
jgi:uncharacterized protein (DUF302 family)